MHTKTFRLITVALILFLSSCNATGRVPLVQPPAPTTTLEPTPIPPMPLIFVSDRDGNLEIYSMSDDGGQATRLTDSPGSDNSPSISPDGQQIVFVSDRDGNRELYGMNIDGSQVTRLTNTPDAESNPQWSPDGSQIVYVVTVGQNGDIYLMDANGANSRNVTQSKRSEWDASWSPDGTQLAVSVWGDDGAQIYRMNTDGSHEQQITREKGFAWNAAWSADGQTLLFDSVPNPPEGMTGLVITESGQSYAASGSVLNITPAQTAIYRISASGGESARLPGVPDNSWGAAFSSDGNQVFFAHAEPVTKNADIYALALGGGDPVDLSSHAANDLAPSQPFIAIGVPATVPTEAALLPAETAASPTLPPTLPPTPTPEPSTTPTQPPTATPEPFVIHAVKFSPAAPDECQTDAIITDVQGDSFSASGTISFRNNQFLLWCIGAKHTWKGELTYAGYTFDSNGSDPLQFSIASDGSYRHISGSGTVTLPDGSQVMLGGPASGAASLPAPTVPPTTAHQPVTGESQSTAAPAPDGVTYLGDLPLVDFSIGFGRFSYGTFSFTSPEPSDHIKTGDPIILHDQEYPHAIFAHPPSRIVYTLGGKYQEFFATIGLVEWIRCGDGAVFKVLLDGAPIFTSNRVNFWSFPEEIQLPVANGQELTLITEVGPNDSFDCDWAVWGDARVR